MEILGKKIQILKKGGGEEYQVGNFIHPWTLMYKTFQCPPGYFNFQLQIRRPSVEMYFSFCFGRFNVKLHVHTVSAGAVDRISKPVLDM